MGGESTMNMHTLQIEVQDSDTQITVSLRSEGEREYAVLLVDDVFYHLERVSQEELVRDYKVDLDPDYKPCSDSMGHCYMLVPFSR